MKLMREITANSCIKVTLHLGDGEEVKGFGRSMGLNYEQMDSIHHFDRGEAICRVGMGYTEPIRLDLYNFQDEPVSDDELAKLMKPHWDSLLEGIEPARPGAKLAPTGVHAPAKAGADAGSGKVMAVRKRTEASGSYSEVSEPGDKPSSKKTADLSSDEQAYLRVAASHPWRLVTEIYSLLNDEKVMGTECIGQSKAVRLRKKLTEKRYLESFAVSGTGKPGRYQCDVVTEKAELGKVPKPRGGYSHGFWCYRIAESFRKQGAEVKIGDTFSGNECDIGVNLDGKRIGVEVVISGLVVDNLGKYISTGYFDEMVIVCISSDKQKEMEKLIGGLSDDVQEKVRVELAKEYFVSL